MPDQPEERTTRPPTGRGAPTGGATERSTLSTTTAWGTGRRSAPRSSWRCCRYPLCWRARRSGAAVTAAERYGAFERHWAAIDQFVAGVIPIPWSLARRSPSARGWSPAMTGPRSSCRPRVRARPGLARLPPLHHVAFGAFRRGLTSAHSAARGSRGPRSRSTARRDGDSVRLADLVVHGHALGRRAASVAEADDQVLDALVSCPGGHRSSSFARS